MNFAYKVFSFGSFSFFHFIIWCFISLGGSRAPPNLSPPPPLARRASLFILDTDDDETQDVPFQNGQDLIALENFDAPPSPQPNVSPNQIDYLDRIERETNTRWDEEYFEQMLSPGYIRALKDMYEEIDEWLDIDGGVAPFPASFKRFMQHNWCLRKSTRKDRIRVNKLRLRYDMILNEEDARLEALFWEDVVRNEANARNLIPGCSICQHDLRNESFSVQRLNCGHMYHTRCIERHLEDNNNPRCPNCNIHTNNIGGRVHFNYQQ